jgi:hypothetical protein
LDEVNCSVLYVLRPCFSHLMYFVFPDNSCILLKISFLWLFYMFISPPPPPPQVPQSFVYPSLQYSPLPFLPVTSQCSCNQTSSSSSSSSSSCSWRVRRVACSLFLKMKLVPPSLPRSSYVPSSFGLHCSACFSSLFVSISVHVVATFNSILHFKLIQRACFWHSWRFCQSHFITSILSTALISVASFVTSHAVLYWLYMQQSVDNMSLSYIESPGSLHPTGEAYLDESHRARSTYYVHQSLE